MSVEQGRDAAAPLSDRIGSDLGLDDIDFDALEKRGAELRGSQDLGGEGPGGFDGDYGGNDFDLGPTGKFDLGDLAFDQPGVPEREQSESWSQFRVA